VQDALAGKEAANRHLVEQHFRFNKAGAGGQGACVLEHTRLCGLDTDTVGATLARLLGPLPAGADYRSR